MASLTASQFPFLDPNWVKEFSGSDIGSSMQPGQAAPSQQPAQQPQALPPGVGEFLASLGKAYQNQGLAAPGHGRNQTIEDRANLERSAATTQRTAFNEAFPRGRGADGLMPVPQINPALMAQGEANRRAGGDPRRMVGDNNMAANQPQVGFERLQGKTPEGGPRLQSMQAPPQSLGGVLTPQYQTPITGRGGDFYDKATGTTSGLINYNAPDGEKYGEGNVWTARGSVTGAPPPAPAAPPALDMSKLGDYLAQHGATSPMSETRLGLPQPPAPRIPFESPSAPPSYSDVSQPTQPQVQPPGVDEAAANQAAWDRYDAAMPKPPKSPEQQGLEDAWNWLNQQNTWPGAEQHRRAAR